MEQPLSGNCSSIFYSVLKLMIFLRISKHATFVDRQGEWYACPVFREFIVVEPAFLFAVVISKHAGGIQYFSSLRFHPAL
jgi:hypothetical protein